MGLSHSPRIVRNGLIFHVDLGNVKCYPGTGTAITDVSYNVPSSTASATPTITEGAIDFDGTYNVVVPSAVWDGLASNFMSVSVWLKPPTISGVSMNVLYCAAGGTTFRLYRNGPWGDNQFGWLTYYTNTSAATSSDIRYVSYTPNTWINTVWTFEAEAPNATMNCYINGELSISVSKTNFDTWHTPSGNLSLSLSNAYVGLMGPLHIFNRTLSADEVVQNFNGHKKRFGL